MEAALPDDFVEVDDFEEDDETVEPEDDLCCLRPSKGSDLGVGGS